MDHKGCNCDWCQDARQIKKGDKFLCTEDVIMDGGRHDSDCAYKSGKTYTSERDGAITDEWGDKEHWWDNWELYFKKLVDKDYFQSITEEYGKRTFESGAVRDSNEGKSRPDLISPYFTERLGFRLAEGANKYEERNWEKGIPDAAFLESLERHLVAYKMGKTDEDHAAAIAFNIMGIIHNEEVRKK